MKPFPLTPLWSLENLGKYEMRTEKEDNRTVGRTQPTTKSYSKTKQNNNKKISTTSLVLGKTEQ